MIPSYEQIPGVSGDPSRDTPQVSGDAFHGVSRLRALAARRARRVNGAEQRAKHDALHQIQHVGKKSERSESGAQERKNETHRRKNGLNETISSSNTSLSSVVPAGNALQLCISAESVAGRQGLISMRTKLGVALIRGGV